MSVRNRSARLKALQNLRALQKKKSLAVAQRAELERLTRLLAEEKARKLRERQEAVRKAQEELKKWIAREQARAPILKAAKAIRAEPARVIKTRPQPAKPRAMREEKTLTPKTTTATTIVKKTIPLVRARASTSVPKITHAKKPPVTKTKTRKTRVKRIKRVPKPPETLEKRKMIKTATRLPQPTQTPRKTPVPPIKKGKKVSLFQRLLTRKPKTGKKQAHISKKTQQIPTQQTTAKKKEHALAQALRKSIAGYDLGAQPVTGAKSAQKVLGTWNKIQERKAVKLEKQAIEAGFEIEKSKNLNAKERMTLYENLNQLKQYKSYVGKILEKLPAKETPTIIQKINQTKKELEKQGIKPKWFMWATADAIKAGLEKEQLNTALRASLELAKQGIKPKWFMWATANAAAQKFTPQEIDKLMKQLKQNAQELTKQRINPEHFMLATANAIKAGLEKEQLNTTLQTSQELAKKGKNPTMFVKIVVMVRETKEYEQLLKLNPSASYIISEQATKGWNTPKKIVKEKALRALQPEIITAINTNIMQRSENRVRRFITPIMEDQKTAEQVREIIRQKIRTEGKLSKKQAKQLPYIAQNIALLNILKTTPKISTFNFKELKTNLQQQIVQVGTRKYGEKFKRKYEQLLKEKAENRLYETLNATSHLAKNYEEKEFEKEKQTLNTIIKKWLQGKQSLEQYKYSDLEKIGVPKTIQEKWKQNHTTTTTTKPQATDKKEILKRLNESQNELTPTQQEKIKEEYEEIKQLIQQEDYKTAQAKAQKLAKKVKELNEDAARHLNQSAGLMIQETTQPIELEITDSLRLNQWLQAGENFGTCQSYTSTGENNRALISFIADGTKKVISAYDTKTGEMKARGVLHLVKNAEGEWALYLDGVYSHTPNGQQAIQQYAQQKATQTGLKITSKPTEVYGKTPYTYMDNAGGLKKQKEVS